MTWTEDDGYVKDARAGVIAAPIDPRRPLRSRNWLTSTEGRDERAGSQAAATSVPSWAATTSSRSVRRDPAERRRAPRRVGEGVVGFVVGAGVMRTSARLPTARRTASTSSPSERPRPVPRLRTGGSSVPPTARAASWSRAATTARTSVTSRDRVSEPKTSIGRPSRAAGSSGRSPCPGAGRDRHGERPHHADGRRRRPGPPRTRSSASRLRAGVAALTGRRSSDSRLGRPPRAPPYTDDDDAASTGPPAAASTWPVDSTLSRWRASSMPARAVAHAGAAGEVHDGVGGGEERGGRRWSADRRGRRAGGGCPPDQRVPGVGRCR